MSGQKPLIHDQRIVFPGFAILAPLFMAREASLVGRYARNFATDEKHFVKDDLRLRRHDRDGSLGGEIIWRWYLSDRQQPATWKRQSALAEHAGMQVARNGTTAVCLPN